MNVPKLPFLEKKNKSEYFLSLVLRDEKVSAVVFEEVTGHINVVGEHEQSFKTSIEDATEEELLDVVDKAVSTAEGNLPPDTESHKTIFGVKQDWIENGKINKDYLAKLKKISDELEFQPMGFLVIPEAISHLLQKEEGAPLTGLLVEVGKMGITVSNIKAGKTLESKTGPLVESSVIGTVDNFLHHFTTEVLPARIILFDGGREKLSQEFISHKWSKTLPFLHVPQVTNLPANFDARAVLNGAASQMGFEVLETSLNKAVKQNEAIVEPIGELTMTEDKTLAEAANEFGFVADDVKTDAPSPALAPAPAVVEDEIKLEEPPKTAVADEVRGDNIRAVEQFKEIPEEVKLKNNDKKALPINAALLTNSMRSFFGKIKLGPVISAAGSSKKLLLIGAIPLILIILVLYIYIFARSAVVTLGIKGRDVTKTEDVTFSPSGPTSASDNTIKAQFLTVSEDGKNSTPATGKKETGDKAKGTVTIFNNSDSGVTLPVGTTLTSTNNLKFITDKAVTVASASGDIFTGTKPGTSNVAVTAEKFGTNYNLPSSTKFDVEGHSSIAAKNDSAFSGGTKKDIKVVAKEDTDKLAKDLQKQLESAAREAIAKKATGDSIVLPNFISVSFDRKSFSKQIGDEATEVSLTATISYKGVSYNKSDINAYALDKLKNDDEKLTLSKDSISANAEGLKEKGDGASGKLTIKGQLIPVIDQTDLAKQIKGTSTDSATEKLNKISEVDKVDIKISPDLPLLPKRLPFSSGKIKIEISKNG